MARTSLEVDRTHNSISFFETTLRVPLKPALDYKPFLNADCTRSDIYKKSSLKNVLGLQKRSKGIQTAGYNGPRTVVQLRGNGSSMWIFFEYF